MDTVGMGVDIDRLLAVDPWLEPFADRLRQRAAHVDAVRRKTGELLGPISQGHHYYGLNRGARDGVEGLWYREWAPEAHSLSLIGEFNNWDPTTHRLARDEWGTWFIFIPGNQIEHGSLLKVRVASRLGEMDRIPAYIRRVVQDSETANFSGQFWSPPNPYQWKHEAPDLKGGLRIYEAHVGMALEDGRVGTFTEFTENILPRIAKLGYDAVQLMAIMEHPYYGSFGYHVSSFFAVSSRFGMPEHLKALVDRAHELGLLVVMDIVHSHAVKNVLEGLNQFDGSDHQYFHAAGRGEHPAWDSMLFDYGKYEVLRFLLSNIRFWLEEYRMDGFRFDGVTSMLYHDHGLGREFGSYDDYFGGNVDEDATAYLSLANELAHQINPKVINVAEDVSGMPGLARPVDEGGIGFDYRLAMGIPDMWIMLLKEEPDEQWNLGAIFHALMNRRPQEKAIAYVESHDQALVGDKTLAFLLMDQQMYWNMSKFAQDPIIDRGIALHKMIRLLTFSLGGEGYLTFMGNEFGHPEWIDFPRAENGFSHHFARRQWSLADQDHLRYGSLQAFEKAMLALDPQFRLLDDPFVQELAVHEDTRQLIYRHGPLVFAFNFHATESYANLRIPVPDRTDYRIVLDTDHKRFGGVGLVDETAVYPSQDVPMYGQDQSIQIYLPARSAQVLAPL